MNLPSHAKWKQFALSSGVAFFVILSCALIILADSRDPAKLILQTDYIEFYTAGHMVRTGNFDKLYMSGSATQMDDSVQRKYASQVPELDADACMQKAVVFAYPAFAAFLFSPFTLLPFKASLLAWQCLSALCLLASCMLISKLDYQAQTDRSFKLFLSAFTLLSVAQTLVIGQTSLVFVLLPWLCFYFCVRRQKPFLAGLALSMLSLKPQLGVPAAVMMLVLQIAQFKNRRQSGAVGFRQASIVIVTALFGTGFLQLAPALFQADLPQRWLHEVSLLNLHVYGSANYLYAWWDLGSLWSVLSMDLPVPSRAAWRVPFQVMSTIVLLLQALVLYRIAASRRITNQQKLDSLALTAISYLPVTALYLSNYDYVIFLLPAWIILALKRTVPATPLVVTMLVVLLSIDVCFAMAPTAVEGGFAAVALTLLQLILLAACLTTTVCQLKMAQGR